MGKNYRQIPSSDWMRNRLTNKGMLAGNVYRRKTNRKRYQRQKMIQEGLRKGYFNVLMLTDARFLKIQSSRRFIDFHQDNYY